MKIWSLKIFIYVIFIIPDQSLDAQTVQWASSVLEFSSELTPLQYSAKQILGKPNVLPSGGENPAAWAPEWANRLEYIKVGFKKPLVIKQIAIAESHRPGAVKEVYIYDEKNKAYLVGTFTPRQIPLKSRMLNIFLEETPFKVTAVKVFFQGEALPEHYTVDAIAISDSEIPVTAQIATHPQLRKYITREKLEKTVNSPYKEFKPLLSPDGKILYFSRQDYPGNVGGRRDSEDIWYSERNEHGKWAEAKNIGPVLNNKGPNFASAITAEGDTWLMMVGNEYLKRNRMAAGVSISTRKNGEWLKPEALKIKDDYNYADKVNYFLSHDRKILMMSVMRDDSYGDRDLYVSFLQNSGWWSVPLNISGTINTAGEEAAPFLAADNRTLYFSSNGFSGHGGQDIFVTTRLDDTWTRWTEPKNLGPVINSPQDDLYFYIPINSKKAYYCQSVGEDDFDIFAVYLPIFRLPQSVMPITLNDLRINKPSGADQKLEQLVKAIGNGRKPLFYRNHSFVLPQTEVREIYFDFDDTELKEEYTSKLDQMALLMRDLEGLIRVAGHTDNVGSKLYNLQLSKRRVEKVVNYLTSRGITPDRIEVSYFGEEQPNAPNTTAEGRGKNRRVELFIEIPLQFSK